MGNLNQPAARVMALALAVISIVVAVLVGNLAAASHLPFAPDLQAFSKLSSAIDSPSNKWRAVHILAAGCRCSRGVAEHIATRGPVPGLYESALLVGSDRAISELIQKSKLPLNKISAADAVDRYHLAGAPWYVLIAPDGSVRYAGGYAADRYARAGYQDIAIWKVVSSGGTVRPLPAFGCAIAQRLKRAIDPLGLKYSFDEGNS